ncbi:mitochondrial 2-enoyl thioester reductase [Orbilia ellipsospora]|uniref:enoyl-[acyl-carrier-protein] reductase n=1 Tax=Orbilia ellipsospora TaxID=2528407 RepID=A0AAV9XMD6_9PEZI
MMRRLSLSRTQIISFAFGHHVTFSALSRTSKTFPRGYATRFGYAVAKCLTFANYGQPGKVLSLHSHSISPPYEDNITVKFLASPINPADINQIEGVYPEKPAFTLSLGTTENVAVPGNEGLVQVVSCGSKVNPSIRAGEWALMANPSFGTWRTYALAKESDLIMIPNREGISPINAATVSVNPSTAYRMLQDFGNLQKGDYFIQNAANSSVGRSAIQIARIWGFRSINIVRDRPEIEDLKKELLSLGGTAVLTEEEVRDKARISEITGGKPIKLALNCVGGESAMNIARTLGQHGHLVTYGAMAKQPLSLPASLLIFKDIHCHGFWISAWSKGNEAAKSRMIGQILEWIRNGQFHPLPCEITTWSDETELRTLLAAVKNGISEFSGKKSVFLMQNT